MPIPPEDLQTIARILAAGYLRRAADWLPARRDTVWTMLLALGVTALASAAFLRWFA